jgi:F-type H+-transporting ATPase subunit b
VRSVIATITILAQEAEENDPSDLVPAPQELFWGAVAFAILFFFMARYVFPRINQTLEQRRQKIQGDMEKAEQARAEADRELARYREQLANAQQEAGRIIEEGRKSAEALRKEWESRAEREYQEQVGRAQQEIRAERDRVFEELKAQVGELSVELAARVVGESLTAPRQRRLVDDYIKELAEMAPSGDGGSDRRDPRGKAEQ